MKKERLKQIVKHARFIFVDDYQRYVFESRVANKDLADFEFCDDYICVLENTREFRYLPTCFFPADNFIGRDSYESWPFITLTLETFIEIEEMLKNKIKEQKIENDIFDGIKEI
jgi:hypothetical protein